MVRSFFRERPLSNLLNHPAIEMMAPNALITPPTHARLHKDKQVEQIARSIDRFGFLMPIVIDEANVVASGVGALLAAKLRKLDLVPCIRAKFLSEVDRRAFSLTVNRLAELSSWDEDLLKLELDALFKADYDLSVTGFDLGDLDLGVVEIGKEASVELPDPVGTAVTRTGDAWTLGTDIKLFCGNAREAASYEAVLGDERARMVFADLPYNVPIIGHVSGLGKTQHREFAEASGEMSPAEFTTFMRSIFKLLVRFSVGGSIHFHCMDFRHARELLDAADGVYSEFKQLAVWNKGAGGMGSFYRSQHELVFIMKSGAEKHINNIGLAGKGARYRTNVWDYAGATTFRKGRKADLEAHPTVKPVGMIADAILDCSNRGDLILDPTFGSGTTLLAAARTGRRAAGIEIDPLYVDTAIRRLMAATGLEAVHVDGRTFAQVEADRLAERELADAR
jgi:DNA modification methylase